VTPQLLIYNPRKEKKMKTLSTMLLLFATLGLSASSAFAVGNPCAAAKPEIDAKSITRPQGYKPHAGDHKELARAGKKLWNDTKLSTNGFSCNTCHQDHGAFQKSFAQPYPHQVAMVRDKAGVKTVHLDEMIQACMVMPMAAKPLPWNSRELAALTAYTQDVQKTFKPGAKAPANPCSAKPANPCAAKPANPCASKANPCSMKKDMKANPCAPANPCAAKPANPCAKK
jgi:cytochrome c